MKKPTLFCPNCSIVHFINGKEKKLPIKLYRNGVNELGNQRYRCPNCRKNSTIATRLSTLEKRRLRYFRQYELTAWCEWPKRHGEAVVDWIVPDHLVPVLSKKQLTSIFDIRYPKLVKRAQLLQPALIPLDIPETQYEYEYLEWED